MQVSVIIPAYNAAAYIEEAVSSALAQKGVDHEVIVIDDGSTDETAAILAGFGNHIRVLRQANAGHVVARNNGAALAKGDWLAFLDADDAWMPNKLATQLARVRNSQVGMVYTDRLNFGHLDRVKERLSDTVPLYEGDVFERLIHGNFVTVSSVIMRRDWFERLGGFDPSLRVCEDWDLWLRYTAEGGSVGLCQEPLTYYRWHTTSMSHNFERMLHGRLEVLHKALQMPRGKTVVRSLVRRAVANAWTASAWTAADTRRWKAIGWYCRSAWIWPWDLSVYKEIAKCCLGRK